MPLYDGNINCGFIDSIVVLSALNSIIKCLQDYRFYLTSNTLYITALVAELYFFQIQYQKQKENSYNLLLTLIILTNGLGLGTFIIYFIIRECLNSPAEM